MNRRDFLRLGGTGLVTTATMAHAGMLAEFLDWLKRKPSWSFPSRERKLSAMWDEINAATLREMRSLVTFGMLMNDNALQRAIIAHAKKLDPITYADLVKSYQRCRGVQPAGVLLPRLASSAFTPYRDNPPGALPIPMRHRNRV